MVVASSTTIDAQRKFPFFFQNFAYRFDKVKSNYKGTTNDGSIRGYRPMSGKAW